jgi:outer membrane protein OmpA-like peptidoglycan-associated protein
MKLRNALLAATIMAAPVAAMAQPVTGPYVSLGAGYNWMQGNSIGVGTKSKPTLKDDGGPIGSVSVGYGLGNGLRIELQGDYRYDHGSFYKGALTGGANVQNYGAFGNVLYDLPLDLPVTPYVGVGAGYEFTQLDHTSTHVSATGFTQAFRTTDQGAFAAQGIAGLAYPLPMVPGLALTAEYRFMSIFSGGEAVHNGTKGVFKLSNQYDHAALIGVRYNFGQAPVAPPPAPVAATPAVAPARTYLVFFDWDKSDLTPRARQIIAEAAQASTRVAVTKIEVNGYADRSGTPAYNQVLSLKRARTVSAELVRLGVPQATIAIMAFGDTHPLVPTAAGVREPQNRRVEIILK